MKRGPPYADGNSSPYGAPQRQQMSAQRMQQNAGVSKYTGRGDGFPPEEERQYSLGKSEGQWQWDRDAQQMSPHLYSDGQAGNTSRSVYSGQMPDAKSGSNPESRVRSQEQDMEVGYDDNPAPQTLEELEKKFRDDIIKLTKDEVDTEDAENARHREKLLEIDNQYQEKLAALRVRHATRREDFLRKESQARLQQYQLARSGSPYQNNSAPSDMGERRHGYGGLPGPVPGEPPRQYAGGQFDSYRQHPESFGRGRMQGADTRVPTPGGRVYSTSPRYY